MSEFNQSLLAKQAWKLVTNPTSLVGRVLKGKYFKDCDFLGATKGYNPSYTWRSLIWGRELLKKGIRWRVGTGKNIRIYSDPWIPQPTSFKPISPISMPINATIN